MQQSLCNAIFVRMTEEQERPQKPQQQYRTLDARSLRGLAHPLRMQLLSALRQRGPATASQLAERLGESSGATSYHLRQLAAHGFVVDAPEHGKGRERWWKAADEGLDFDDALLKDPDPAVRGAADVFLHEVATTHARELSTWLGTRNDWSRQWIRATDMSDMTLRLTPDLARELIREMHDLVESYRALAPAEGTPDAEQVRIHTHAFPFTTN
ncbi:transcriptional regulator [Streptomyces avermitilis]|uniref:ArsR-family transcriptional regulator n=3 Tax=Streptomyces TaxID=1883 RepID=Q82D41_STRAW|nr:putative ArsR-family transcriptional regulator [Streptomyces avermitilis MA-4680 = NBRC 14893]BBJ53256.1 transcriptional regulator [Streptomyces avermitilis]GDY65267.1 transcriptional regulator [Streptomyces avermitilis]GDY74519.1 transcriptional regulator [Streptomyces avermitilis]GDY83568.1 transcriptional regulator [Streptomyces avermitilis]